MGNVNYLHEYYYLGERATYPSLFPLFLNMGRVTGHDMPIDKYDIFITISTKGALMPFS